MYRQSLSTPMGPVNPVFRSNPFVASRSCPPPHARPCPERVVRLQPLESQGYLRIQMMERMSAMRAAKGYLQERKTRWVNDTRGLVKEADRLLQRGGAPKGWLERKPEFRTAGHKQASAGP